MAKTYVDGGRANNAYTTGAGQIGGRDSGAQGVFAAASSTQNYPLGTRREFEDGRVFRYCHFVGAVTRGQLCAQDFSTSGDARIDTAYTADIAAGATQFTLTDAAITSDDAADVYAGGYFIPMEGNGEGYAYRIKSNGVGSSPAANQMVIDLFDPIIDSIDSEEDCAIIGSPYKNLTTSKAAVDTIVAGVAVRTMAANEYGWVQTWGVGCVLADESAGTISAGTIAQLSDDSDAVGEAQPYGAASTDSQADDTGQDYPIIGYFLVAGVDTEHVPIFLQIQP